MRIIPILALLVLLLSSCSTTNRFTRSEKRTLKSKIEKSSVFREGFTGFVLYDPKAKQYLYRYNADKHFTPASNTKILTYYVASQILGDSIPAFKYLKKNDSLIILGTADPAFLNSNFFDNQKVIRFFEQRDEQIFISFQNFDDEHYGKGWMWDDYLYSFQPEKSSFPIYGNVVEFEQANAAQRLRVSPRYFENKIIYDSLGEPRKPMIKRIEKQNEFVYKLPNVFTKPLERAIPMIYSDTLTALLLGQVIGKPVSVLKEEMDIGSFSTFYATAMDTLFRQLMQESDNFIAEELLLACSQEWFQSMNTEKIIEKVKDSLLYDLPQSIRWVDGSGISRYNQITPDDLVFVLNKIYEKLPFKKVKFTFPTGGETGTIKEWYGGEPPYVHAKTGTMSNVHCLSGYLETKSGNLLIFSFMHNNYLIPLKSLKIEMQSILTWIRDNY